MGYLDRLGWQGFADERGHDLRTGAEAFFRLDEGPPLHPGLTAFGVDFDHFSRFRGDAAAIARGDAIAAAFVRSRQQAGCRVLRRSPHGDEFLLILPLPLAQVEADPETALRPLFEPRVDLGGTTLEFTAGAVALKADTWPIPDARDAFALCLMLKARGCRSAVGWRSGGDVRVYDRKRGAMIALSSSVTGLQ